MARWSALTEFLATAPDRCLLSMEQLEEIVGTLPRSARTHRAYWSGERPQVIPVGAGPVKSLRRFV